MTAGTPHRPGPLRRLTPPARLVAAAALGFAMLASCTGPASAHFLLNINIRVFHVVPEPDRVRLLVRLPMAWLVADRLGRETAGGARAPAPYTMNRIEDGRLVHYLDAGMFRSAPRGLAGMLAGGLVLEVGGEALRAEIGRVRAWPAGQQPPFAALDEAESALSGPAYPEAFEATYVGDTMLDAELIYPTRDGLAGYALRSTLDPGLPGQDETANVILDHASAPPLVFRISGPMARPVEVSRSAFGAARTFVEEGIRHILAGLDHVLFVLCLVLGATTLAMLAWQITGFTIGHSITLTLGFFGHVPQGAWFVPLVEIGIAVSILYAATVALIASGHRMTVLVTTLIGLLHGLGFSFVLKEILNLEAPNLWQSLLAFNAGVEIGQLLIVVALWPLLALVARRAPKGATPLRWAIALPCVLAAAVWTGERTMLLVSTL